MNAKWSKCIHKKTTENQQNKKKEIWKIKLIQIDN